ncbi:T9SS type A sorting domain-containing protein [Algoriphagus boseongensis]|uniref:T9SS type A sorting domain-containing protein n=1 Tax=Algoriphagus boseongensis TaxID=1442587 RepID=UPI00105FDAEE|nr:T9SS type A sorting domain-containing protein [Algoriphagus boseongensis]
MKRGKLLFICAVFLGLLFGNQFPVFSQFKEIAPIEKIKFRPQDSYSNFRTQAGNLVPFWDDFSKGIDTLKWVLGGVSYTETIGNQAPSIGMILFNGVDENGRPYSNQIRDIGESDFLTSKPFDLSLLTSAEKDKLYLSFYWQAGGKAEAPDINDELTLQVFKPDETWQTIWSQSGGNQVDRTKFFQENLQILPEWQHADFQFRFISQGRKSGPFDSWLIDYVYLNTLATSAKPTFPDRALTQTNQFRIGDYGAYPLELIGKYQKGEWSTVKNEFLNLENRFRAMEYSISVIDSSGRLQTSINQNTPFNPVPNALERRTFVSRTFEEITIPSEESDLFFLSSLTSGDGLLFTIANGDTTRYAQVNFADNDTVRTQFPLRDFFAYDNGSADYSAGINQKSGQLVVSYFTPEPVFLKGISINFTNPSQANQAIDLVVYEDLSRKPIFVKENVIPVKSPGEDFLYFSLDTNLRVSDEFFIGFTQFTNDFIHVGLDKTNDLGDKIYYNIGGGWVQNEEVKGSLMIRPHVSINQPFEEAIIPESGFRIYPNPVQNLLTIDGEFEDLVIYDSYGRQILLPRESRLQGEIVNFENQKPGIYIINVISSTGIQSFRIQVSK